jgi:mRNA interferase MazF
MPRYVPEAGDIVWLNFTPQAGHEQAGHRPALVLSPASYNDKTSLLICCPLTTQIKNYPFEVLIAGTPQNAVLADQVKSLDWRARKTVRKGAVSFEETADVRPKIRALIGLRNICTGASQVDKLDSPPGRLCGIGQPNIDRPDPEDGDHSRLLSIGRDAIVVPGAGMAQDIPAGGNGHGLLGCEIRAALHPPCS